MKFMEFVNLAWYAEKNLEKCRIIVHRSVNSCAELLEVLKKECCVVLFPTNNSISLTSWMQQHQKDLDSSPTIQPEQRQQQHKQRRTNLIVFDGTWKQARSLFSSNRHLLIPLKFDDDVDRDHKNQIVFCHLENARGQFTVRRPPKKHSNYLSTYESIVIALKIIEDLSDELVQGLLKPLHVANDQWERNVPESLKCPRPTKKN